MLNRKDKRHLNKLNAYLEQRTQLVLTTPVLHTAMMQRIEKLITTANELDQDDSPGMLCGLHRTYAWKVEDIAKELRFLLWEFYLSDD